MLLPTAAAVTSSIAPPLMGFPGAAITLMQAVAIATSFSSETNSATRMQYSKFFNQNKSSYDKKTDGAAAATIVPSRTGMTIIYGLPFIAACATLWWFHDTPATVAGVLVTIHFAKRLFEVQYIHKYSGSMALSSGVAIGSYYSLVSILIATLATTTTPSPEAALWGTALFTIGSLGNLYHHIVLARLRSSNKEKKDTTTSRYVVPTGGLFDYVAAPHYLFELVAWFGMAVATQHANAFLVFAGMTSYLAGRAVSQNEWNRQTFGKDQWPADRKNLVPFVF